MFCTKCAASLPSGARFCSGCGEQTRTVGDRTREREVRRFEIPLPDDSPFRRTFLRDSARPFTREHLSALGVARPHPSDYYQHRGFTYLWNHYSGYFSARLNDLAAEGWELAEEFEPKRDLYGVITSEVLRDRFIVETSSDSKSVPSGYILLKGVAIQMQRLASATDGVDLSNEESRG